MHEVDIAIVGGGMVGASLALALAGTGREVLVLEGIAPGVATQPSFDDRTSALGNATRRIFEALGVWGDIAPHAAAIRTIHISDAGRFGFARLQAAEQGIDAFGFVVTNRVIGTALWSKLAQAQGITIRAPVHAELISIGPEGAQLELRPPAAAAAKEPVPPTDANRRPGSGAGTTAAEPPPGPVPARELISARLVVAADGANSTVRAAAGIGASVEDYNQIAIIANLAADRPHDGTAYERFTPEGPIALLPLWDGSYGVVCSADPAQALRWLALEDAAFLAMLQTRFGWRAGRLQRIGRRASYPLKLTRASNTVATRAVLIGNAAQALHPVAGQGFNLGLRDAAILAELLAASDADPGSPALLARFEQWRSGDRSGVIRFTDGLVKLFGDTRPGMGLARDLGLLLFDLMPPAKSALSRVSAGFAGPTPRLARGLAVR